MIDASSSKVSASHLERNAYLYVRQSTLRQVVENTESTQRQYALRQRALALGWEAEQIVVIDSDQGKSGASAAGRTGFGELVAEVGVGRAGIVLGLEVSRLARNNADWHRLLEICALTATLILDEDGVYDPAHYNDRLLLGLKGTMSEAELARSRFMQVDPSNRLVADSLEAEWNEKLRALEAAREEYERGLKEDQRRFDERQRERILVLASDFPALWNDDATPHRERKRMAALLIEDVTLIKRDVITAHVRCRGGRAETLHVAIPKNAWQLRQTDPRVVAQIDRLLDEHTDGQVAAILGDRGISTGTGEPFTSKAVQWVRRSAGLKSLRERLRAKGMLTTDEMATQLGVCAYTVKSYLRRGLVVGRQTDDRGAWLFEPPDDALTATNGRRGANRRRQRSSLSTASSVGGAV